ncbi:MAG: hypothetical protein KHZ58_10815 [Hungatella hathewayi]|nr:hypothetical protein [Hungatella hathewayi]
MRKRKALMMAGLAALLLVRSHAEPAYAAGVAETSQAEFRAEDLSTDVPSELKGTIKVELISVELPVGGLEFEIDPSLPFSPGSPGEQIKSPSIQISNHSVVPVQLEIAQVPEVKEEDVVYTPKFGGGPEQKFRLLGKVSEVQAPGAAILVLGTEGQTYRNEADFEQYAILPGRENIPVTRVEAWGSRKLKLYGKVNPDFYGAFQFTVTPTLKISTVQVAE